MIYILFFSTQLEAEYCQSKKEIFFEKCHMAYFVNMKKFLFAPLSIARTIQMMLTYDDDQIIEADKNSFYCIVNFTSIALRLK